MATPAKSCLKALQDATGRWPNRNASADGIMGDAAHQARKSDHNDGNAFDLTHDPGHGVDCGVLSRKVINDARVTYVIWNREIYNRARAAEGWRKYDGANPHNHHMHVSIHAGSREDLAMWPWSSTTGHIPFLGQLRQGSTGAQVGIMQKRLADLGYVIKADNSFGIKTKATVMQFQRDRGMLADGVVGKKTWAVLMAGPAVRASGQPTFAR
jgi:putative peptidoglycan binding protein